MSYVLYEKATSRTYRRKYGIYTTLFKSVGAAKATRTREAKKGNTTPWEVADAEDFAVNLDKTEMVRNLMTGKLVEQSVNTPLCCDVSSETYWCM